MSSQPSSAKVDATKSMPANENEEPNMAVWPEVIDYMQTFLQAVCHNADPEDYTFSKWNRKIHDYYNTPQSREKTFGTVQAPYWAKCRVFRARDDVVKIHGEMLNIMNKEFDEEFGRETKDKKVYGIWRKVTPYGSREFPGLKKRIEKKLQEQQS